MKKNEHYCKFCNKKVGAIDGAYDCPCKKPPIQRNVAYRRKCERLALKAEKQKQKQEEEKNKLQ